MTPRLFQDARDFQIFFLCAFLFLGVFVRDFDLKLPLMIAVFASALLTQYLLGKILNEPSSLRSSSITGISLCLLLRSDSVWTMIFAGAISIAAKFVFRSGKKHFINPSNFGLICALVLTGHAWVTPGQWGTDIWLMILFLSTGGLVVRKVGRLETTTAFLLMLFILEAFRNYWLGWTPDVFFHKMSNGAILLFAFFMITDPRSIPNHRIARMIWACMIAILAFVLKNFYFVNAAMFWALFLLAPLTPLFDLLWRNDRFFWQKPKTVSSLEYLPAPEEAQV